MMNTRRLRLAIAATALALVFAAAPSSEAAGTWAPEATATIHPGVQTVTEGAQCTATFIFSDGTNTYIGQAAHCSGTGAATDTNGCDSASLPLGTAVDVGGVATGTLVYNSWLTMQANGETNPDACAYNDLALVKLDPADVANVNPTVPKWGGPTGVGPSVASGNVYSYGNSSLRLGITLLSPKLGTSVGTAGNGWSTTVYTVTPGIPGDSGSGFLDAQGRAFGVLSTVAIAPLAGSNGVGSLQLEIAYMHAHSSFTGVQVVNGTRGFTPGLPIG
jgi:hypothetical protein